MLFVGAPAVITAEPDKLPWPIAEPGRLYSPNWSISALVKISVKNWLILSFNEIKLALVFQFLPQKTVNTFTLLMSGPPLYTSLGGTAGAPVPPSSNSSLSDLFLARSASFNSGLGLYRGTTRIDSGLETTFAALLIP